MKGLTVANLGEVDGFKVISIPVGDREIKGVYIGDLLSWVMGKAKMDNAWITIMSNINTVAVASLTDVSCIILAEGVNLDEEVIKAAESKEINILSSEMSAYEIAILLNSIL